MDFSDLKTKILSQYSIALHQGLVDPRMKPINQAINAHPDYFTTSSCSGRVILISKDSLRSKYRTRFHTKIHEPDQIASISIDTIEFEDELWFLFEPPNIHVRCRSLSSAKQIHQLGLRAKLAKSKFQSIGPAIVVEVLGTTSFQLPLGISGHIMVSGDYLDWIKQIFLTTLKQELVRLDEFHRLI